MSFKENTSNTERSRTRLSSHRRFITLTTHVSIVFAMSLAGTLTTGYFLLNYVTGDKIKFSQLLHGDLLFPLIAIAMCITLGAGGIVMFTLRQHRSQEEAPAPSPEPIAPAKDLSPPILRLHRNAERLNEVERNLAVKISHSDAVDLNTRSMLAEMQMCTKRLMGGLAELEREGHEAEERKNNERRKEQERELVAY